MSIPLLICDDSSFARKQMARALPDDLDVDISFASNGAEGIEAILAGKADVLFLDLNMPVMDGYEVLKAIRKDDLPTIVIVVSGDIQPEAHSRVINLGALDFIKKPIDKEKVANILNRYGLLCEEPVVNYKPDNIESVEDEVVSIEAVEEEKKKGLSDELIDCYREIANVAMGQAADLLARLLNVFVILPVPNVNLLEASELHMALQLADYDDTFSAVCQGFIGEGISGEALMIFNDSSFNDIATLMKYKGVIDDTVEIELIMDIAGILIGAALKGIADQLDMGFSQGHPVVIGQHCKVADLVKASSRWKQTLAIEINYKIKNYNVNCELLLLFTEDTLQTLNGKVACLLEPA